MFPWATEAREPASGTGGPAESGSSGPSPSIARQAPRWAWFVPLFLSSLFFLSGFFTVFAPLPLLLLAFQKKWNYLVFAAIANAVIVHLIAGPTSFAFYLVSVITLSIGVIASLRAKVSIERSVLGTAAMMLAVAIGWLWIQGVTRGHGLTGEIAAQGQALTDYVLGSLSPEARENWLGEQSAEEWRRSFLIELPSAALISALMMIIVNILVLLRLNPSRIRERLGLEPNWYRRWKTPDWLVYPAILVGAVLVADPWLPSRVFHDVAMNGFKLLMAVYALQGLSILAFVFEAWRIRGLWRLGGYLIAVLLMMPLVLSLGFFDLWFDFRGKLRQS